MTILKEQMTRPVNMISYSEAQRIFDDGFPSFEDMIAGAKNVLTFHQMLGAKLIAL